VDLDRSQPHGRRVKHPLGVISKQGSRGDSIGILAWTNRASRSALKTQHPLSPGEAVSFPAYRSWADENKGRLGFWNRALRTTVPSQPCCHVCMWLVYDPLGLWTRQIIDNIHPSSPCARMRLCLVRFGPAPIGTESDMSRPLGLRLSKWAEIPSSPSWPLKLARAPLLSSAFAHRVSRGLQRVREAEP
jgi:hypothetical protein